MLPPWSFNVCRTGYYMYTAFGHDLHFGGSRIIRTANDGARMTHAAARRSCLSGNETNYGLLIANGFYITCGFGFHTTANFPDHYDGVCFCIIHEQFHGFFGGSTDDGVATDANGGRDTRPAFATWSAAS